MNVLVQAYSYHLLHRVPLSPHAAFPMPLTGRWLLQLLSCPRTRPTLLRLCTCEVLPSGEVA